MHEFDRRALALLRRLTGRPDATFREGQLEAVRALAGDRKRVLVVQRTGWGKSAVYFIATRLLRDAGSGPTLLVSPLLALMRNQIDAAERMGVRAATINSSNTSDWEDVVASVEADGVDVLLISPERLANREFRESVLDRIGAGAGLVVVDEAHCISDWGHDFRPDYRRIRRVVDLLPRTVPVLACTATANDRVVNDIVSQLGADLDVFRGPLAREGLALQVINLDSPAARMAWLARSLPRLGGSGIVYCLTKRDAELVAEWLARHGISARSYTGDSDGREEIEQALLANQVDVVVATSALGMGFDKPDLAYVIHFQAPGSVIAYYQQVGRAGRQLPTSVGVLLRGREDSDIQDWFITSALPTAEECSQILAVLEEHDGFVKLSELEAAVNVKPSRISMLMKNLEVDGVVVADGQKYQRTPRPFSYDTGRVEEITALRRQEQAEMLCYGTLTSGCRMTFLGEHSTITGRQRVASVTCAPRPSCRPASITPSLWKRRSSFVDALSQSCLASGGPIRAESRSRSRTRKAGRCAAGATAGGASSSSAASRSTSTSVTSSSTRWRISSTDGAPTLDRSGSPGYRP